jgi:trimeric autotransporter adhesin
MSFSMISGNVQAMGVLTLRLDPPSLAVGSVGESTYTVPGLRTGDFVFINPSASLAGGLGIIAARVSASDTLALRFSNDTAGAINPPEQTFTLLVVRPGGAASGFAP